MGRSPVGYAPFSPAVSREGAYDVDMLLQLEMFNVLPLHYPGKGVIPLVAR